MTRVLVVILLLFSISRVSPVDTLLQGKFRGSFGSGSSGSVQQIKIPNFLNQVCYLAQGSNATLFDACYGCFYRASTLPQGYGLLVAMSACADAYLNNTNYGHCQAYLQNMTSVPNLRSPSLIYCSFLECLRQVNSNTFLHTGCISEATEAFLNINDVYINLTDTQIAQLSLDTTIYVLAKIRCSYMNPITDELQNDDIVNKLHLPSLNAVFVNTDYDINIVQLPFRYNSDDVCAKYRNVEQPSWPSVAC